MRRFRPKGRLKRLGIFFLRQFAGRKEEVSSLVGVSMCAPFSMFSRDRLLPIFPHANVRHILAPYQLFQNAVRSHTALSRALPASLKWLHALTCSRSNWGLNHVAIARLTLLHFGLTSRLDMTRDIGKELVTENQNKNADPHNYYLFVHPCDHLSSTGNTHYMALVWHVTQLSYHGVGKSSRSVRATRPHQLSLSTYSWLKSRAKAKRIGARRFRLVTSSSM